MTDKTETELLPVTQEDIAIALEHLGYDSVDDLHYWAENDTELRRFDELCSRFARHRLNTRPNQGHLEQALGSANRQPRERPKNVTKHRTQAAPDDGLLADLHTEADLCRNEGAEDIARLLDRAIAAITALRVRPSGDGLVAELENLAARTRGMWSFDQANELCALFPRILTALRARPSGDGEAE